MAGWRARPGFLSLHAKILLPLLAVVISSGLAGSWFTHRHFTGQLNEQLVERARHLAHAVADVAEITDDPDELPRVVSALGGEQDVALIVVTGGEPARVLACTRNAWAGLLPDELPDRGVADALRAARSGAPLDRERRPCGTFSLAIPLRLYGQPSRTPYGTNGVVLVRLDARPAQAQISLSAWRFAAGLLAGILLITASLYLCTRAFVLRPLAGIRDAVRRRAAGDRGAYAPARTNDEIGLLAHSFNAMLDGLDESERQVRASESQLRALVSNLPGATYRGPDPRTGAPEFVSDGIANLCGYPASDFVVGGGRRWADLLVGADAGAILHEVEEALARHAPYVLEYRIRHADGSLRWIRDRGQGEYAEDGSLLFVDGVLFDITSQRLAEEARTRLAAAMETITDLVGMTTIEGRVLYLNRAARQALGVGEEEFGRVHASDLLTELSRWVFEQEAIPAMIRNGSWRGELVAHARGGRDIPVSLMGVTHQAADGSPECISIIGHDMTEHKRAETELRRARAEAVRASRLKSEFLTNMSHEIRTPMNGVVGMTSLLLGTQLTPEQRDYAEAVRVSADALLELINNILDLSRIEAGRLTLESVSFDPRLLAEEVAESLAPRAQEKGLDLAVRWEAGAPRRLCGDAARVRQVLTNLVGNAIKFTSRGHVLIQGSCAQQAPGKATLRLLVSDTGMGIPPEELETIFEKFSQGNRMASSQVGGTGLGLTISRELVELMGGKLRVTSRPGEGTCFSLTLPLAAEPQAAGEETAASPCAGMRMLVVGNQPTSGDALVEDLRRRGIRAEAVPSGEAALRALRRGVRAADPYRLAFVDEGLPGADGETVGLAIRSDAELAGTLLVLLASLSRVSEASRLREAGFVASLAKPVREGRLEEVLALAARVLAGGSPETIEDRGSTVAEPPSSAPSAGAPAPGAQREPEPGAPAARPSQPLRALVAEDHPISMKLLVKMLENLGCQVETAPNGREALARVKALPYDMVFMDCLMPEMDGYEAAGAIRRLPSPAGDVPIVAVTANAMKGEREKCLAAGMSDYVSKPVQRAELVRVLERWGARPAAETGDAAAPPATAAAAPSPEERTGAGVDRSVLAGLRTVAGPDSAFLTELFASYFTAAHTTIARIHEAIEHADAGELRQAAHSLKGSSGNAGARAVAAICQEMEELCAADSPGSAVRLLPRLEEELNLFRREIGAWLYGLGCGAPEFTAPLPS